MLSISGCCELVAIGEKSEAAEAFVGARKSGVDAGIVEALSVGPIVTLDALGPIMHVGLGVVVHLVAVGAVFVLLVAQTARVAQVQDFALDEAVAPQRRVRGVAVGALVVLEACTRGPPHLLAGAG